MSTKTPLTIDEQRQIVEIKRVKQQMFFDRLELLIKTKSITRDELREVLGFSRCGSQAIGTEVVSFHKEI